jgi:hypothetical protein
VRIAAFDSDGLSQPSVRSAAQERRDEIDVPCGRAPDMAEGFEKIQSHSRNAGKCQKCLGKRKT